MTKLVTYSDLVELANTDTLLQVTQLPTNDVDIYIQHEADTDRTFEASATFSSNEFRAFVQCLYTKFVLDHPLMHSNIDFNAE